MSYDFAAKQMKAFGRELWIVPLLKIAEIPRVILQPVDRPAAMDLIEHANQAMAVLSDSMNPFLGDVNYHNF